MARTEVAVQRIGFTAGAPTFAAVDNANGMHFRNSGKSIIYVKNGGVGSINVTVPTPGSVDGLDLPDKVVAVPNGGERAFSLRKVATYVQSDGFTRLDFSGGTSVTIAILEGGGES